MKSVFNVIPALIAGFLMLQGTPACASPANGASAYIQELGNQALAVISNKSFDKTKKQVKLEKIFSDNVDFPWVGRFVMGNYWRQATDAQRTRYVAEYKKFLLLHYTSRFTNFSGGTFKILGEKDDGEGEYTVAMQMKPDDPDAEMVEVDYRVRKEGASDGKPTFKIFDVIVEGVGLLTTQRSEFSSVIADKGIDYLINQLAEKSKAGAV